MRVRNVKILKRDIKNTFDDVQYLAEVGLAELKKTKEGREKITPLANKWMITRY